MKKAAISKWGVILASVHLYMFARTIIAINASSDPQAHFAWISWFLIDLPWSLLYFVGRWYGDIVSNIYELSPSLANLLYLPHLIHGVIGTIWWYYVPTLLHKMFRKYLREEYR